MGNETTRHRQGVKQLSTATRSEIETNTNTSTGTRKRGDADEMTKSWPRQLVVHYHRPRADYGASALLLQLRTHASFQHFVFRAPISQPITAWGLLFRIRLSHLVTACSELPTECFVAPCSPHAATHDTLVQIPSAWLSSSPSSATPSHTLHVFLISGVAVVHADPTHFSSIAFLVQPHPSRVRHSLHPLFVYQATDDVQPTTHSITPCPHPVRSLLPAAARLRSQASDAPLLYVLPLPPSCHALLVASPCAPDRSSLSNHLINPPAVPPPFSARLCLADALSHPVFRVVWQSAALSALPDHRADLRHLLVLQADRAPLPSLIVPSPPALSARTVLPPPSHPLTVYLHHLSPSSDSLTHSSLSASVVQTQSALDVLPAHPYHGQPTFSVSLQGLSQPHMESGVSLTLDSHNPQLSRVEFVWTPSLGLHVVFAPAFPRLLTPPQVDVTIVYHRFHLPTEERRDWHLHVWSDAGHAEDSSSITPHKRIVHVHHVELNASHSHPNALVFSVLNAVFSPGARVYVQPVRVSTAHTPSHPTHTPHFAPAHYGDLTDGVPSSPPSTDVCDLSRHWTAAQPPASLMHIVQGDPHLHLVAPCPTAMRARRFLRLRYRRFHEPHQQAKHGRGDLRADATAPLWDLWTWDHHDSRANHVPIATPTPVPASIPSSVPTKSDTTSTIEFVIDRAAYPAGHTIGLLPRRGGDDWIDKDEPSRLCCVEDLLSNVTDDSDHHDHLDSLDDYDRSDDLDDRARDAAPSFLILQGSPLILRTLDEVRSMLEAWVDSRNSICIRAPVPVSWLCPNVADTRFEQFDQRPSDKASPRRKLLFDSVDHCTSLNELRFVLSDEHAIIDEDFPVEHVLVSVPRFEPVVLTWKLHDDTDKYHYSGQLGWQYSPTATTFRVFAPIASRVSVVLYNFATGDSGRKLIPMRRIPEGCWKGVVAGNLSGRYYKLLAEGDGSELGKRLFPGVEVIDPYSRCNTAHTGKGLIFSPEEVLVGSGSDDIGKMYPRPDIKPAETILYEVHIRDVSSDEKSGITSRGKFLGLTERGTRLENEETVAPNKAPLTQWGQETMPGSMKEADRRIDRFSTGLDHIVQMGVNTIQILPIQDFDNDESNDNAYRWGYMPVHFNSPDGWYASDTHTVARITEFKQLVSAIHKAGLKVIMDVVYNHTAEDPNEFNLDARFSFNGLAPRYYYRTCGNTPFAHNGHSTCGMRKPDEPRCGACYSNGSGCGNEFRSESPMGRKFILDSLKYWATEYMVDGFRFDLLGLLDVQTLSQAATELKKIHPNIMVYGEPWCAGLTPIKVTDKGSQRSKGFSVFNDMFRCAVRGSSSGTEETFVMDGGRLSEVKGGIVGSIDSFCDNPLETINYVECHDNYTLWDHMRFYIRSRIDQIEFTDADLRRMHRLAAVLVFTSQGVPFMQVGQEMCRTKFDVENSYESPDEINKVRWKTKTDEWSSVLYYRGLILLRRSHPEIFCLETAKEVRHAVTFYEDLGLSVPDRCIAYNIKGSPEKLLAKLRLERELSAEDEVLVKESQNWSELVVLLNPTPSGVRFKLPYESDDCLWLQIVDATSAGVRTLRSPAIGFVDVAGRSGAVFRKGSVSDLANAQLDMRLAAITDSYCSFHGDDALSEYAVGLRAEMTAEEEQEHRQLIEARERFERLRVGPDQG